MIYFESIKTYIRWARPNQVSFFFCFSFFSLFFCLWINSFILWEFYNCMQRIFIISKTPLNSPRSLTTYFHLNSLSESSLLFSTSESIGVPIYNRVVELSKGTTYPWPWAWRKMILFPRIHQWSIVCGSKMGRMKPSVIHVRILISIFLCRSCVAKHSCCVFRIMTTMS